MKSGNSQFQIGGVARETSASIDTVPYYEKLGLLDKPIRARFTLSSKRGSK